MSSIALFLSFHVLLSCYQLTFAQSDDEPFILVEDDVLPFCDEQQFITFNGTHLVCRNMTERPCNCPVILPDPPPGCQHFPPPPRGGFLCLRTEATIYCSVQCDNTSEFSSFPFNPYRCGPETIFYGKTPQQPLIRNCPSVTVLRQTMFPESNYIPVPCDQLTEEQKREKFEGLLMDLQWIYGCTNCDLEQAFVDCPPVPPNSQ
ncbi:hypothetical protein GBAR_LOCUS19222 [Geodia barretti]|uniref:Uncharacterized protein n=1 Tax=Geodia barretti TaxID=519541 RepID=A0AA35X190_GEOBA|nr:hypothetical protein GBAR_LOCUS19222 [Geodia barretti]